MPMNQVNPVKILTMIAAVFALYVLPLASQPKEITILHTNDMHASFLPHEAYWVRGNPKPLVGGFNELAFAIDSLRHCRKSTLLLDAGDIMTGNPITDRTFKGAEGGALIEMLNLMGYEGQTPGNHDFDISCSNYLRLKAIATYPVFSANLVDEKTGLPVTGKEYVVIEKNGLKIGMFGIMSREFYNLVTANSTKGIKLLPPIETAKRLIDLLEFQTDLLIAVTHQGVGDDSVLAAETKGIDVIVGGHSHTRLRRPNNVNGVLIVQAGSNAENLGILDLTVDKRHHIAKWNGELHQLWYNPNRGTTVVSALVDSFKTEIRNEYSEVIGTLSSPWNAANGETAEGYFLADAQREAAHADIGFMNNGGIRKRLSPGPITKQDLFEVLPFRNILTTFSVTGSQIRAIVLNNIAKRPGILISGIDCEWKRDAAGNPEIVKLLVNGNPVSDTATYTGAASDYMMGEAERYLGIAVPHVTYLTETVFAAVEARVRADKIVSSNADPRIKELK
ncbi:MAG TPA: bifunctional UDP-sugar hydrolase/5'-nucleotidase [Bacteroidota bacterium]